MWMDLESVIQSEVSHKEKTKYLTLMHIYGIQKDGTVESTCRNRDTEKRAEGTAEGRREGDEWRQWH